MNQKAPEPLPPYSFVPGQRPHPNSDPRGHSFGKRDHRPPAPDPANGAACPEFLRGVELFNHGYYWEAHESWEGLWHACGRRGEIGTFLKGLIHLTAAGVKVREQRPPGVRSHAARARQLFQSLTAPVLFGLEVSTLVGMAREVEANAERWPSHEGAAVAVVFPFRLDPITPPSATATGPPAATGPTASAPPPDGPSSPGD